MRYLVSMSLTILGLALIAPTPAWSQSQRHLCPQCQMIEAQRQTGGAPIIISGAPPVSGCAECAAMAGTTMMPGAPVMGNPMMSNEPPGFASLGNGARVISGEPAPIDIVRASYAQQQFPSTSAAQGMSRPMAGMGTPAALASGPMVPTAPVGWVPSSARRPSVLTHLFGLEGWGQRRRDRAERAMSAHAALPLGSPAGTSITELPASAVFGR